MMTATPTLAHIVLQTNHLPEMRDWYLKVLGAHVVYQNPAMCFMTFDDEHHRIALVSPPGSTFPPRTPLTVGLSHSAYTFPTLGDLIERYLELSEGGIEPQVPVQHGVTTSLYYRDPDTNMVELQIDNFPTAAQATEYMHGREYSDDTIGPTFDAALLATAFQAGVPETELTTRAWALQSPQLNVLKLMST
jgi:catechol-2,3-dioxygenase